MSDFYCCALFKLTIQPYLALMKRIQFQKKNYLKLDILMLSISLLVFFSLNSTKL